MNSQAYSQKKGEIEFRKKASEQHTGTISHFVNEFNSKEMLDELKKTDGLYAV